MNDQTHKEIRSKMRACGVWNYAENMKIYTSEEFINQFGDKMPNDLIVMIKKYVKRLQYYFDDRILEPIS